MHYVGGELELFAEAHRWKRYLARQIAPFLGERVLEVGAGIGGTTTALVEASKGRCRTWMCLEPDLELASELRRRIAGGSVPSLCAVRSGTVAELEEDELFDAILYIDVLEHIDDDAGELRRVVAHLRPRGRVVVVGPAHPWLYSPFDASVGHHRRYTRASLLAVAPRSLVNVCVRYLDTFGLLASLANRFALREAMPTARQLAVWDRFLVAASSRFNRLLGYAVGKSILGVWRRV